MAVAVAQTKVWNIRNYQIFLMGKYWPVPWLIHNKSNVTGKASVTTYAIYTQSSNASRTHQPCSSWMGCWKELAEVPQRVRSMWQLHLCRWLTAEIGWLLCFLWVKKWLSEWFRKRSSTSGVSCEAVGSLNLSWGLIRKYNCVSRKMKAF